MVLLIIKHEKLIFVANDICWENLAIYEVKTSQNYWSKDDISGSPVVSCRGATRYVIFYLVVLASFHLVFSQIFSKNPVCHKNQFFVFNKKKHHRIWLLVIVITFTYKMNLFHFFLFHQQIFEQKAKQWSRWHNHTLEGDFKSRRQLQDKCADQCHINWFSSNNCCYIRRHFQVPVQWVNYYHCTVFIGCGHVSNSSGTGFHHKTS